MNLLVVLCTFPDIEKARQTGTALIEAQLAACVNLCPAVESIYRWEGSIETASEVLAIFKTTREAYPELERRLKSLHPYEVPEIVALPPLTALDAYARWLEREVRPGGGAKPQGSTRATGDNAAAGRT